MHQRYRLRFNATWNGPHYRISDDRKTLALRPFAALVRRGEVTPTGVDTLARQAHAWYSQHKAPIPGVSNVTLASLLFSVWLNGEQVAEIDATEGYVLLFEPSH